MAPTARHPKQNPPGDFSDIVRERLIARLGKRRLADLSAETGIGYATLYRILTGSRGLGAKSVEAIRTHVPELIADLFAGSYMEAGR